MSDLADDERLNGSFCTYSMNAIEFWLIGLGIVRTLINNWERPRTEAASSSNLTKKFCYKEDTRMHSYMICIKTLV